MACCKASCTVLNDRSCDKTDDILRRTYRTEFLISFEAWAKLAQKWLVCAPLRIHLERINKELMLLVTI